jgi:hypothetical protein
MIYESTGEVRAPKPGEFYLTWSEPGFSQGEHSVSLLNDRSLHDESDVRVIMRPVEEPKPKQWHVGIPYDNKAEADSRLEIIAEGPGYFGTVEVR